jgi:hypothetical protein
LKGGGAFGIVQAYAAFVEAQDRGALHAHQLLWSLQQLQVALTPTATADEKRRLQQFVDEICTINMPLDLNVCPTCGSNGTLTRNADCNVAFARTRRARAAPEPPLNICTRCSPPTTCTSTELINTAVERLKQQYAVDHNGQPFDVARFLDPAVQLELPPPNDVTRPLVLTLLRQRCNMHSHKHMPQCFKTGHNDCVCRYGFPLDLVDTTELSDQLRLQQRRTLGNEYVNKSNDLVQWLLRCNNDVR